MNRCSVARRREKQKWNGADEVDEVDEMDRRQVARLKEKELWVLPLGKKAASGQNDKRWCRD